MRNTVLFMESGNIHLRYSVSVGQDRKKFCKLGCKQKSVLVISLKLHKQNNKKNHNSLEDKDYLNMQHRTDAFSLI